MFSETAISKEWWISMSAESEQFLTLLRVQDASSQDIIFNKLRFTRCPGWYTHYRYAIRKTIFYPYAKDEQNCIDRHKTIASVICAILATKPLHPRVYRGTSVSITSKLSNEYYCIYIIDAMLRAWNNGNGTLDIEEHVQRSFIALLHLYGKSNIGAVELLALSHIIFCIEKLFFE
jgi:hypothetical protein